MPKPEGMINAEPGLRLNGATVAVPVRGSDSDVGALKTVNTRSRYQ